MEARDFPLLENALRTQLSLIDDPTTHHVARSVAIDTVRRLAVGGVKALLGEVDRLRDIQGTLTAGDGQGTLYKHIRRGTDYHRLGLAEVQISTATDGKPSNARQLFEGDRLVVYRAMKDGKLWARFPDEFDEKFKAQP